jgi:hypothetical protein
MSKRAVRALSSRVKTEPGAESSALILQEALGLNAAINQQWTELDKFREPRANRWSVMVPTRLVFGDGTLSVELAPRAETVADLAPLFRGVDNVFNVALPSWAWFDLSKALEKYRDLRETDKTTAAIQSWKTALENVHVLLGKCHESLLGNVNWAARVNEVLRLSTDNFVADTSTATCHRYEFHRRIPLYRSNFAAFELSFTVDFARVADREAALQEAAAAFAPVFDPAKKVISVKKIEPDIAEATPPDNKRAKAEASPHYLGYRPGTSPFGRRNSPSGPPRK